MRRKNPNKPKPSRFAWFFCYHVFDLEAVARLAATKPILTLTTVCIAPLLADGEPDRDLVKVADTKAVAVVGRVPIGDGNERYLLLDGYEIAKRCEDTGKPLRLRILSRRETKLCRLDADSSGEWPNEI